MRDYQQKTSKYILPRTLYHQTIWQIRDYYRLMEQARAILDESPPPPDGMPRGTQTGDGTAAKAVKREAVMSIINIIDTEKKDIPPEYREGVWNNILFGTAYPLDAGRATYGRYKSRFVYNIAKRLYLL